MKNLLIILVLLFCITHISQAQKCASIRNLDLIKKYDITTYNNIMDIENHTSSFINSKSFQPLDVQTTVHIPVIVHVLYSNSTQNISDDQILSQIAVLNEDFNRLNSDRINTPAAFSSVANGAYLDFFLACIDPNGNPTNGITRTQTSVDPFTLIRNSDGTANETATRVKFTSLGGYDAWPRDRYLNIWVCNLTSPLLGYTQFPGMGTAATDGVVIKYNCFGRVGTLDPTYNKGRTTTHEVGHWLNLIHIWGDDDGSGNQCSGSDFVDDTPNQQIENYGCPSFPHTDNCTTQSPGVMFMDYMDYTDDACMNLYTTGQVNRMRSLFSSGGARECFVSNTSIYRWCNSIMTFTGNPLICSSGAFTVNNVPPGCTITWTPGPYIGTGFIQGSNPCTFTSTGNGSSHIRVTINSNSCGSVILPDFQVEVRMGAPATPGTIGFRRAGGTCYYQAFISPVPGADSYDWSEDNVNWNLGYSTSYGLFNPNSTVTVYVRARNGCGISPTKSKTQTMGNTPPNCTWKPIQVITDSTQSVSAVSDNISIYPNPAESEVTLCVSGVSSSSDEDVNISSVAIVDSYGNTRKIKQYGTGLKSVTINISDLPNGFYYIRVNNNVTGKSYKLLIQK